MSKVLVLNNSNEPLNVCSWARAMAMITSGKVDVVDYSEHSLGTGSSAAAKLAESGSARIPAVIRLKRYVHVPQLRLAPSRRNILHRDGYACRFCGAHGKSVQLTLDHVTPRCQGGKNSWENLVTACQRCNNKKGGRTLEQSGMKIKPIAARPKDVTGFRISLYMKLGQSEPAWEKYIKS